MFFKAIKKWVIVFEILNFELDINVMSSWKARLIEEQSLTVLSYISILIYLNSNIVFKSCRKQEGVFLICSYEYVTKSQVRAASDQSLFFLFLHKPDPKILMYLAKQGSS